MVTSSITRRRPRRRRLGLRGLCGTLALVLSAPLALWIAGGWSEETRRVRVEPYIAPASGGFFAFSEAIGAPRPGAASMQAYRRLDPDGVHAAPMSSMGADALARGYLAAYDGYQGVLIKLKAAVEAHGGSGLSPEAQRALTHPVSLPDGTTETLPLTAGLKVYDPLLRMHHRALQGKPVAPDLSGDYRLNPRGDCRFGPGPARVVEKGRFIEVRRDGALLLLGVAGAQRVFLLATEPRFARVTVVTGPFGTMIEIEAPERVSEIYAGRSKGSGLSAAGQVFGECAFDLW